MQEADLLAEVRFESDCLQNSSKVLMVEPIQCFRLIQTDQRALMVVFYIL